MRVRTVSAKAYYRRHLREAEDNFDFRETTISHRLRERNPFLRDRSYGEAFFQSLGPYADLGSAREVLEVGAGCGDLARGFVSRWARRNPRLPKRYTIADLSPALIKEQRKRARPAGRVRVRWVQADAHRLPFRTGSFRGIVISNEVIADLDAWQVAGPWRNGKAAAAPPAMKRQIRRFREAFATRLRGKSARMIFPHGVVSFLDELHRVMEGGALAVLTEYFDLKREGRLNPLHRHMECRLSLDLVSWLARECGFLVQVVPLADFLDLQVPSSDMTRMFRRFVRDELGYPISPSLPIGPELLRRDGLWQGRGTDGPPGGFFSRLEAIKGMISFHVLLLRKRPEVPAGGVHGESKPVREPDILTLRSRKGETYLVRSHPFFFLRLNATAAQAWAQMNGRNSLEKVAARQARRFGISKGRALRDTLELVRSLERRFCLYTPRSGRNG